MVHMSRSRYAQLFGPTTGDRIRLADTDLLIEVTEDRCLLVGDWLPGFVDGAWWQVLTSGFAHVQLLHIGFNMLALWILGPQLERLFGRTRFLALYLLSLLAGSVVVLWAAPEYQATLGASGAIYGLFAALVVCVRKVGGDLRQLGALIAVNLLITFTVPNISWQGHLFGAVGGLVAARRLATRDTRGAGSPTSYGS